MALQRWRKALFVDGNGVSASGLQQVDETIRSAAPAVVTARVHSPSLPVCLPASKSPRHAYDDQSYVAQAEAEAEAEAEADAPEAASSRSA